MPVDAASALYDGTPLGGPDDLRGALLRRSGVLVQNFIENLMTFALGRRLAATDMASVRAIARQAEPSGYRFSAFVLGIVKTPAFRMKGADELTETGR